MPYRSRSAVIVATLLIVGCGDSGGPSGARALEGRLVAPCGFNGTLDIHESPLARELRVEIESRVAHGESSAAIQQDFVSRFGADVVAARTDAPLRALGILGAVFSCAAGVGLLAAVARWARRGQRPLGANPPVMTTSPVDVEMDERLDAELRELD